MRREHYNNAGKVATTRGWRPATLRPSYLLFLACVMAALMLVLETLRQISDLRSGLLSYDETEYIPNSVSFAYNYVPTIIGLCLLILWSFMAYDVFRLEPYFQISAHPVFSAELLTTNYNFGPHISTPISAVRRRHWVVVAVALVNLLMQFALPSLLSNLMEVNELSMNYAETVRSWPNLVNTQEQSEWLSTQSNSSLRSLLTPYPGKSMSRIAKFAIPPVELPVYDDYSTSLWTLNHTVYWTDLSCSDLSGESLNAAQPIVSATETQGNRFKMSLQYPNLLLSVLSGSTERCTSNLNYTGVFDPATASIQARGWELVETSCGPVDLYGFFVNVNVTELSQMVRQARNLTAESQRFITNSQFFSCNLNYHTALGQVSMRANASAVAVDVDRRSVSTVNRSLLDVSGFKTYLKQGICFSAGPCNREAQTNQSRPHCSTGIDRYDHLCPDTLQYPQFQVGEHEFKSTIGIALKSSSARLIDRFFKTSDIATPIQGNRASDRVAIVIVSSSARGTEVILLLGVVTCLFLAFLYHSRENILRTDPGSIAAMCGIVADLFNPLSLRDLVRHTTGPYTTLQLRRKLRGWQCYWDQGPSGARLVFVCDKSGPGQEGAASSIKTVIRKRQARPVQRKSPMLHFLSIPIFIAELVGLLAVISTMATLFVLSSKEGKFRDLSQSASSQLSLVLGVVPALVASVMRNLFTSIYLNLGILEPWIHLQKGRVDAQSSLLLNLSSQTPFAVLYRSLRSHHYVLSLVSLCCIVNISLPAVFGALFTQSQTQTLRPTFDVRSRYDHSTILAPEIIPDFYQYGAIESPMLNGLSSLAWMTSEYSFIPLSVATNNASYTYEAATLGVGADLTCKEASLIKSVPTVTREGTGVAHYLSGEHNTEYRVYSWLSNKETASQSFHIQMLAPSNRSMEANHTGLAIISNLTSGALQEKTSMVALLCQPTVKLQNFTVRFDANGMVNGYVETGVIAHEQLQSNMTSNLADFHRQFVYSLQRTSDDNATFDESPRMFVPDWPGSLVKLIYEQTDPHPTSINTNTLAEVTQHVYQWLFATYFTTCKDFYFQRLPQPTNVSDAYVQRDAWSLVRSPPSFIFALLNVSFMTFVLIVVFSTRYGSFEGPRVPRSLGSVLAWIASSPILERFHGTYHWDSKERSDYLVAMDKRYTFRTILGPDGEPRWVIEEDPPEKA
ncbi:hypothetical protein BDV25DRAFT_149277 [Aspergillus avenaceus]|uniref:Uncharacterized protein n=1 Tax=Aspergillus avenaceus TaxID=36643 RepID=A0A5N6U4L6_ASPAV|nr:hypothetical protein BDV25DRAFT_149277 [Aspergillus avenaceus]